MPLPDLRTVGLDPECFDISFDAARAYLRIAHRRSGVEVSISNSPAFGWSWMLREVIKYQMRRQLERAELTPEARYALARDLGLLPEPPFEIVRHEIVATTAIDVEIICTANRPALWSVLEGRGAASLVNTVLQPHFRFRWPRRTGRVRVVAVTGNQEAARVTIDIPIEGCW